LSIGHDDINLNLGGLLLDLAHLAGESRRAWGFARAARAVLRLDRHVTPLVEANTFRAVPGIGPTTDRIARELLSDGRSSYVDEAVRAAGQEDQITALRALRQHFLSTAAVHELLTRPAAPARRRYRGDFQMHSVWSDGADTLDAMAAACLERGYRCAGITDHSYGLAVARGMSMAQVADQHAAIDRLNATHGRRFRLLKGIEANIRPDGTIDMEEHELRRFEFVVASPHSLLRKTVDQTARMVAAVSQRGVSILGHPVGRRFNARPGVHADWDLVFEEASRRRVAIEIDGSWERQDVHYELASRALARGCLFALDSDAHSLAELAFADVAIAHARLAGIPEDRIVNYWPTGRILQWAREAWER
jgi:histidinol phosphatase-like PHP family hydrolase